MRLLLACLSLSILAACSDPVASAQRGRASEPEHPERWSDPPVSDRVRLTDAQWRERLSRDELHVLREEGTERPFTGRWHDNHADGTYRCAGCGQPLYSSAHKFDSGTGWPSFYRPIADGRVREVEDRALGMVRTEVECARCGGHLGHVFDDGPRPTGERHCINSISLDFDAD